MRRALAYLSLTALMVFTSGCEKKEPIASQAECEKVMDHVAKLVRQHHEADPQGLWEGLADVTVFEAKGITKETFKDFLKTPEGKAFMDERQAAARAGMDPDLERCTKAWTRKIVQCMLEANDQKSVQACFPSK